jgi:hypothetical protein
MVPQVLSSAAREILEQNLRSGYQVTATLDQVRAPTMSWKKKEEHRRTEAVAKTARRILLGRKT